MTGKFVRHGEDVALVIEKSVLEELNIDADTPVEIATDGVRLVIVMGEEAERRRKFNELLVEWNQRYGRALKLLAD